jgi:hypothetical protein
VAPRFLEILYTPDLLYAKYQSEKVALQVGRRVGLILPSPKSSVLCKGIMNLWPELMFCTPREAEDVYET